MNDNNTHPRRDRQPTPVWVALVALISSPVILYFAWIVTP